MLQIFGMKFVPKILFLILFIVSLAFQACNSSEDPVTTEARDYAEQALTDDQLLREYLQTHTFNYEDFDDPQEVASITIDTLDETNSNKRSLDEMALQIDVPVLNQDSVMINHTLYYLIARQGIRVDHKPSIVDSTYLNYSGKLLDGTEFDASSQPIWFDATRVITGFRYGLQFFAPGTYTLNDNGTVSYQDYGQGLIFIPSGLGYFNSVVSSIPFYSPLIFDVSVLTTNQSDHDGDGVLSVNEDPDGDGNPYNDDTDDDGVLNLYDTDDDDDGVLTKNEYDLNQDGIPDDDDGDGIPNYLDND